jgi:ferredoxin
VVIELLEIRGAEGESRCETAGSRLALEEDYVFASLCQPQGGGQSERSPTQNGVARQASSRREDSPEAPHYITVYNCPLRGKCGVPEHEIEASVDQSLCVGSGPCFVLAPRAFALGANMKAVVLDPAEESEEALLAAAEECPTQAIYLSEAGRPRYP